MNETKRYHKNICYWWTKAIKPVLWLVKNKTDRELHLLSVIFVVVAVASPTTVCASGSKPNTIDLPEYMQWTKERHHNEPANGREIKGVSETSDWIITHTAHDMRIYKEDLSWAAVFQKSNQPIPWIYSYGCSRSVSMFHVRMHVCIYY